jgi:cyclophilin family peptidyl-prolyl cis-trans isomerase
MQLKLILIVVISLFLISCGEGKAINTGGTMKATFETNQGNFEIQLDDRSPITTNNFIKLAKEGYYDGQRFHRVIPGFMIQGGDPLSKDVANKGRWGTGDPGYKIQDEFHPELRNDRGTISMANAGPNTGGSQFFINVVNNNFLDNKHAVFGHVTSGMDIVDRISNVQRQPNDQPVEDVVIQKVSIR